MKLAIFDFDDTLISGQSLDLFYRYVIDEESSFWMCLRSYLAIARSRIHESDPKLKQEIKYSALNGINNERILEYSRVFAARVLETRIQGRVWSRLEEFLHTDFQVVVVSAGLECYLAPFFKNMNVRVISSRHVVGQNGAFHLEDYCYGRRKLEVLQNDSSFSNVDWSSSWAFSDHRSDLPLLELVGHPVVVSKNERPSWALDDWEAILLQP